MKRGDERGGEGREGRGEEAFLVMWPTKAFCLKFAPACFGAMQWRIQKLVSGRQQWDLAPKSLTTRQKASRGLE